MRSPRRSASSRVEVRRRNLIGKSAMPYALGLDTLGTQIIYDSGEYARTARQGARRGRLGRLQAQLRAAAPTAKRSAAASPCSSRRAGSAHSTTVAIEVDADGGIEVVTGIASVGQGVETVIAQICADALGVDYTQVSVIHGQTDRIEKGMGAFASRVTVMCGEATRLAAVKLRGLALSHAAELMQAAPAISTSSRARSCASALQADRR